MEEKIRALFSKYQTDVSNYTGTDFLSEHYFYLQMILPIEEEFNIIINDDEMDDLDTVEKIITLVKGRMNE